MSILAVLYVVCLVVSAICSLIILVKAFQDHILQGILCLLIPIYMIYFAWARMESERKGLLMGTWLGSGLLAIVLGFFPASAVSSSQTDPCLLITKADVEAALNEPAGEPQSGNIEGDKACMYETRGEHPKQVVVWRPFKPCPFTAAGLKAISGATSIPGLGDDAVSAGDFAFVFKGNACVRMSFIYLEPSQRGRGLDAASIDAKTALARKALARLPK